MLATDRIFHLSHTDLDGYGCQFMLAQAFYNVAYYNCDYKEVNHVLVQIVKQIKIESLTGGVVKFLLISDLNLTISQADWLESALSKLTNPPEILLIDHHATGAAVADKYSWYKLDINYCATKLVWQWVKPFLSESTPERIAHLEQVASLINVTDMWLKKEPLFHHANFIADIMFERPWYPPNMTELGREYRFHLIDKISEDFLNGLTVLDVERHLIDIRLDFLRFNNLDESIVSDENRSLDNKFYELVLEEILRAGVDTVRIDNLTACVFFAWSGTLFQHLSSRLFERNKNIAIAIRISSQGKLSLRSNDPQNNVGLIAQKYYQGGGHPCAAGGQLRQDKIDSIQTAKKALLYPIQKNTHKNI